MEKIVSRFRGKLVKTLKILVVNLMIVQFRLKLDKFFVLGLWINWEILQKAKKKTFQKSSSWVLFKKQGRNKRKVKELIQKLVKRRKRQDKEYQRKRYEQLIQYKKEGLQNKWVLFLLSIRMREKTLKFDNIRLEKKEFHKSKQSINLDLVNVDQIAISDNLSIVMMVLNILLVTEKVKLWNRCVLSYLKSVDI